LLIAGLQGPIGEFTMKKTFALVAVLALATAACSKPAEEAATEADTTAVAEEPMAAETPAAEGEAMAAETPAAEGEAMAPEGDAMAKEEAPAAE
jgi:hypothetical protein